MQPCDRGLVNRELPTNVEAVVNVGSFVATDGPHAVVRVHDVLESHAC